MFSCENKAYEEGGSISDGGHYGLSGHARKEQAGRFYHHSFLLKHFCSNTVSLNKGDEHRVIFKKGFSALLPGCENPAISHGSLQVQSFWNALIKQRKDPILRLLYLPKGLIPCLRRASFLAEEGLFLCGTGNFSVPVDHNKREKE